MKNLFKICFFFLSFISATSIFATASIPTPCSTNQEAFNYITLPAGTIVYVELNETVSSNKKKVGNTVAFTVRNNVVVHGKIVILAGSTAFGKVKEVNSPCDCNTCNGEEASITIVVENAQAVDGTMIYLNASPHTASGNCFDGSATIEMGTAITGRVRDNNRIYP